MLGLNAGVPRGPLTELEEAHKEVMRTALKNYGLEIAE
jgi:hypothetical protein